MSRSAVIPGNTPNTSYWPTVRAQQSIAYLIALARARLRLRARAVEVSFDCRFERAIQLSCRQNAVVFDPRLPGGSAAGKIIAYKISVNGDTQELIGSVTIGCAVGTHSSVVYHTRHANLCERLCEWLSGLYRDGPSGRR